MSEKDLLAEQNKLIAEQNRLLKKQNKLIEKSIQEERESARRERYERLKAEGRLPLINAIGRGFGRTPEYHEWDGCSEEEAQYYRNQLR